MKLLKRLFGAKAQYLLLLTQEQQVKENSKRLGIQSLILSIVGTVLTVAFVVLGALCHANFLEARLGEVADFPIFSLIGIIAFYGLAAIFLTSMVFSGVLLFISANSINRRLALQLSL